MHIYIYLIASKQLKQIINRLPSTVSPIFSLFLHHTTPFLFTSSRFTKPSRYPPRMTIPPSPAGDLFGFIKVQKFYKTSRTVEAIIFPGQANRNPLALGVGEDAPVNLNKQRDKRGMSWQQKSFFEGWGELFLNMHDASMSTVLFGACKPAHVL